MADTVDEGSDSPLMKQQARIMLAVDPAQSSSFMKHADLRPAMTGQ